MVQFTWLCEAELAVKYGYIQSGVAITFLSPKAGNTGSKLSPVILQLDTL